MTLAQENAKVCNYLTTEEVLDLLDCHARELAEIQRQAVSQASSRGHTLGPAYLIGLIDPKAKT